MRKFDYSFLKTNIPANIYNISNIIVDLNSKQTIRKMQYIETFTLLQENAKIASVKGSNAIEGIVTTNQRIQEIMNGAKGITHDEMEIEGYKNALSMIHEKHDSIDLNEQLLQMIHQQIFEHITLDAGQYKKQDNLIMEYHEDGTRKVRFVPISANETKEAMEQLLLAYYDARQDAEIPSLLLIPCVILDFLFIHPYRDGNGRISRLITNLLLYQSGYDIGKYISYEEKINEYKDYYYYALQQSSINWHENTNDYSPFIINFLQLLYRCYKELDDCFMEISLHKAKKSERIEAVIMNSIVPISKVEIAKKLPDVSIKTIETVLGKLVKSGAITKIGKYKDARYYKK